MKSIIRAEHIFRSYKKANADEIKELKGLTFSVEEQEFVGIMGKSGCGKTTLLKVLGLIDAPTFGTLHFYDKDTKSLWKDELSDIRRRKIGFVFQDYHLMDSISVQENIMLPLILDKVENKICYQKSEAFAGQFELTHLLHKNPYELSGGEKQRVAICRALINNPDLILADEPTGNLDSKSGKNVVDTLVKINQEMGKTVIMVTHDPMIASHCKRILFLKDGKILEEIRRENSQKEFYQEILGRMARL